MKLHRLTVENINSLRGKHVVDFEHLFSLSDILLIAGETGAGKSTLLDAVHIALFGRTPRLSQTATSKNEEESVQHVMTRGAGSCDVSLEFSVLSQYGERETYRASWHLHRARNRPDGRIQTPTEILEQWDDNDGTWANLLEDGRFHSFQAARDYVLRGLNEEDFLRTVMLPQGKFDELLSADEKARAAALRRIVNVDQIEAIGRQVASNTSQAKADYERELAKHGAQQDALLSDEDRHALQQRHAAIHSDLQQKEDRAAALDTRIQWVKEGARLQENEAEANQNKADATEHVNALADDRQRLQEYQRLQPAMTQAQTLQQSRLDRDKHANALQDAQRQVADTTAALVPLQQAYQTAFAALKSIKETQDQQQEKLQQAFALWESKREQENTLSLAQNELKRYQKDLENESIELASRQKQKRQASQALQDAKADQRELGVSAEALTQRSHIESHVEQGKMLLQQRENEQKQYDKLTERKRSVQKALQQREHEQKKLQDAKNTWEAELRAFHHDVPPWVSLPLTDGAQELSTAHAWHQQLDAGRDEIDAYGVMFGTYVTEAQSARAQAALLHNQEAKLVETQQQLERLQQTVASTKKQRDETQKSLEDVRHHAVTNQKYLSLILDLQHTGTCPVCGTHHPSNQQQHHDALHETAALLEKRIHELEQQLRAQEKELSTQQNKLKEVEADAVASHTRVQDAQKMSRQLHAAKEAAYTSLQHHPFFRDLEPIQDVEALPAQLETIRDRARDIRDAIKKCDHLDRHARTLEQKWTTLQSEQAAEHKQLQTCTQDLDAVAQTLADLHTQLQSWSRTARKWIQTADFARFAPVHTHELVPDAHALLNALEHAKQVLEFLQKCVDACTRAQERLDAANMEETRQAGNVSKLTTAVQDATATVEKQRNALQKLIDKTAQYFEGKDPKTVQQLWQELLETAQNTVQNASDQKEEAEQKKQRASQALGTLQALYNDANERVSTQDRALQTLLQELGVEDEGELLACTLPQNVVDEISINIQKADNALRSATAACEAYAAQIQAHQLRGESMGACGEDDEADLTQLREEIKALQQELGRVQEQLEQDDARKIALAAAGETLATLYQNYEQWDRLHQLVGVNKGEKFAEFALALSLGELISHANHQLKTLAPRYQLRQRFNAKGIPVIDFEITDRDLSNDTRPISNLSGGERFQLSLAMALGLSSMSKSILPIETLLIDEGFGTLDPMTLDKAIQTLTALYQNTGAKVVLISHVERLRETLPTKIIVRKRGGGYSELQTIDGVDV